jgi:hypothetical protein
MLSRPGLRVCWNVARANTALGFPSLACATHVRVSHGANSLYGRKPAPHDGIGCDFDEGPRLAALHRRLWEETGRGFRHMPPERRATEVVPNCPRALSTWAPVTWRISRNYWSCVRWVDTLVPAASGCFTFSFYR